MSEITLATTSDVVCKYIGTHELLCMLGFESEELGMHRNPDGECFATIEKDGREFAITLGFDDRPHDVVRDEALRVVEAVNAGLVPQSELTAVVVGVRAVLGSRRGLIAAIRAKGIAVPKPEGFK